LASEKIKTRFLAERKRAASLAIPELIALLESDDLARRFSAEMRLRELSGI
jgi:hypothetical protein